MRLYPLQRPQDVDGVENVIEDDVIERLVQFQRLEIALHKIEFGMVLTRARDHLVADFHADAVRGANRSQHVPGLATQLQHTFVRLDDELQRFLITVVEISIRTDPLISLTRDRILLLAARLAPPPPRVGSPALPRFA